MFHRTSIVMTNNYQMTKPCLGITLIITTITIIIFMSNYHYYSSSLLPVCSLVILWFSSPGWMKLQLLCRKRRTCTKKLRTSPCVLRSVFSHLKLDSQTQVINGWEGFFSPNIRLSDILDNTACMSVVLKVRGRPLIQTQSYCNGAHTNIFNIF